MNTKEVALNLPEQYEKQRRIRAEFRAESQMHLVNMNHWQSCLNCEHWSKNTVGKGNEGPAKCTYYDALPPPDILVVGCAMHDFDIPF
uniref:Uncharacterized protein n=1 Tax=Pseudomonas phage Pavpe01 TaxID=3138545 RepID=A0AAU6W0H3_9VIRU